jgi:hypothetical protein
MPKERLAYPNTELFHKLWTIAVGQEGYVKDDWMALERQLEGERQRAVTLICDWLSECGGAHSTAASDIRETFLDLDAQCERSVRPSGTSVWDEAHRHGAFTWPLAIEVRQIEDIARLFVNGYGVATWEDGYCQHKYGRSAAEYATEVAKVLRRALDEQIKPIAHVMQRLHTLGQREVTPAGARAMWALAEILRNQVLRLPDAEVPQLPEILRGTPWCTCGVLPDPSKPDPRMAWRHASHCSHSKV